MRQTERAARGSTRGAAVVWFAKAPRAGRVKTRLCPPLTPNEAAALYGAWLLDHVAPVAGAQTYLYGWPDAASLKAHVPTGVRVRSQRGRDLWRRMRACFAELFAEGHDRVVLRNTDSPDLPAARVREALASKADVVLGPDRGGGYYLIGLRAPRPELFMGAARASVVRARARAAGLSVAMLRVERDVDRFADLVAMWRAR